MCMNIRKFLLFAQAIDSDLGIMRLTITRIDTLNSMPNLKTCTFIPLDHTMQKDIVVPYSSWYLAPLTPATTLYADTLELEKAETNIMQIIDGSREKIKNNADLDIKVLAIHGREREYLPSNKLKRAQAGWEMDWFG